jgi:V/A-type H+/Na+-transporting ATPase subunit I
VIVKMSRLRVMGPRDRLSEVIKTLQDIGLLHLVNPPQSEVLLPFKLDPRQERQRRYLRRAIQEVEYSLEELKVEAGQSALVQREWTISDFAHWVHLSRGVSRQIGRLKAQAADLEEEQALILKYRSFLSGFESVLNSEIKWTTAAVYNVLLRGEAADPAAKVRDGLAAALGGKFELRSHKLPSGETALLIFAPASAAAEVDRVLQEARVEDIPVPAAFGGQSLAPVAPRMLRRLDEIPFELEEVAAEMASLGYTYGTELEKARAAIHDRLEELEAQPLSGVTRSAFVVEGWLPVTARQGFDKKLHEEFGDTLVVSELSQKEWKNDEVPVLLHNSRAFRPFEVVISLLPLPHYGTIDPTPFVALFFPLFFGIMLGDVGYGILFAVLGFLLMRRTKPGSMMRNIAVVGTVCAAVSIVFGFMYGEMFGDLGSSWFSMPALVIKRETALQTMLIAAIALGFVHIMLGLILGVRASYRHHRRLAIGRAAMACCVFLVAAALLSEVGVISKAILMPAVIGLLVFLVVLVVAEGFIAAIELLSTLGNILSYARLMAIGTASVMLALVANQMSSLVPFVAGGILIAFLFHVINFVLGLFAPTIHSLRLHYVEFFGKFYSGGGKRYRPLAHWGLTSQRIV